jgi:drug/metabolite transporter (DMT)-like permease
MQKLSSVVTSVYALTFGTLLLIPLGVWQLVSIPWHLDLFKLMFIIYMGCFVTGFAFFLNLYGINLIGSGRASIFNNLQPVFSIVLSVLILGESLAIYHLIGFVLVVSGIVLSLTKKGQSEDLSCSESAY